jgi:hypothetical protein
MLQVGVHHGDHFTTSHFKTSADRSSQAAAAPPRSTVHKADRRFGKHCLADRVRGAIVRVVDEDELPIEPARPKSGS